MNKEKQSGWINPDDYERHLQELKEENELLKKIINNISTILESFGKNVKFQMPKEEGNLGQSIIVTDKDWKWGE